MLTEGKLASHKKTRSLATKIINHKKSTRTTRVNMNEDDSSVIYCCRHANMYNTPPLTLSLSDFSWKELFIEWLFLKTPFHRVTFPWKTLSLSGFSNKNFPLIDFSWKELFIKWLSLNAHSSFTFTRAQLICLCLESTFPF